MQKSIRLLVGIGICFFSLSCEKSNPVDGQGKPTLNASESYVTVALNYNRTVNISGGKGSYSVKSMTDSTIVSVTYSPPPEWGTTLPASVHFLGNKLGTTKIIIQDSAKSAEVEIIVTVSVMASSPSTIIVKNKRSTYSYIVGGTPPYSIIQFSNPVIATVILSGPNVDVEGISEGSTSVTISDNSTPAHIITIPITVLAGSTLTTAGKISFTSTIGVFDVEGIYSDILSSNEPSNDAGAGGIVTRYGSKTNIGTIIGYKKKSVGVYDIVLATFVKNEFVPSIVSLDSASSTVRKDNGGIIFGFNVSTNSQTSAQYITFSGDLTLTRYDEQKAEGTFQGHAGLVNNQNGVLTPGSDVTISQGSFSVPLIVEDESMIAIQKGDQAIFKQIEKMLKPHIDKMKEHLELQKRK